MSHRCGSGAHNVKVTASGAAAPLLSTRFPALSAPGARCPPFRAPAPGPPDTWPPAPDRNRNRNDGTSMLLSRAAQPQRWPIDVAAAATMAQRCGSPPPPDSIDATSLVYKQGVCPVYTNARVRRTDAACARAAAAGRRSGSRARAAGRRGRIAGLAGLSGAASPSRWYWTVPPGNVAKPANHRTGVGRGSPYLRGPPRTGRRYRRIGHIRAANSNDGPPMLPGRGG